MLLRGLYNCTTSIYRISSYKALPRIIPATLIMPAVGTLLCRWNLGISNKTRTWRPNEKLIPAGLIWGNTVYILVKPGMGFAPLQACHNYYIAGLYLSPYCKMPDLIQKFENGQVLDIQHFSSSFILIIECKKKYFHLVESDIRTNFQMRLGILIHCVVCTC